MQKQTLNLLHQLNINALKRLHGKQVSSILNQISNRQFSQQNEQKQSSEQSKTASGKSDTVNKQEKEEQKINEKAQNTNGNKEQRQEQSQKTEKEEERKTQDDEYEEESEKNQFKTYRRVMFAIGKTLKYTLWLSFGLYCYHMYLLKKTDHPEKGFLANEAFLNLARTTDYWYNDLKLLLTRPPVEKLLPDRPPLPPGQAYPKTLVINLRGTLVHSEYKFGSGFEILKRPGLSVFLQRLSRYYELVIFGDEENSIVTDICEALDPNYNMIAGRLGRESTLLKNGKYVKDLSYLNRDVKDIVYIDFDDDKAEFQKENVIVLPRWEGDFNDRELYDIMPFLENLAQSPGDVRNEIRKYGKEGTGKKYQEIQNARRELILKQRSSGIGGMVSQLGKLQGQPGQQQSRPQSSSSFGFGQSGKNE